MCLTSFRLKILLSFSCFVLFALQINAQLIAFPGADGAGKFTSGGRGTPALLTTVFEVTTLKDTNAIGSIRYACTKAATYRTIVFRVSGTIHLNAKLNIPQNTTVAGQTAPGGGICFADYPVAISGNNVIMRYIRCRLGDKNQLKTSPAGCGVPVAPFNASCMPLDGSGGDDAMSNTGNKNIIIDHCSLSWSNDEVLSVYRGDSITLQWNIMSEPLNYSYHFETGDADFEHHGYGGIWGSRQGSFHHNLFAHCKSRNPRFAGNSTYPVGDSENCDFRNNVIYNWELFTVYGGEGGHYNLVNNYYKYGPNTSSSTISRIVNVDSSAANGWARYFLSGNYMDGSTANTNNNWSGAAMLSGKAADSVKSKVKTPYLSNFLPTYTSPALVAVDSVLQFAGAVLPTRDTLDKRIVNDVRYRKGRHIDVQGGFAHATPYSATVNAWPFLENATAPVDTDKDGMPDSWESANGLNANNAADRGVVASNGYTNLENYLNGITFSVPDITFSGVLDSFYQPFSIPSLKQTMRMSSSNLLGNVTMTPPVGFEISINDTDWYSNSIPMVLMAKSGVLGYTTLYIRLNTPNQGVYGGNIVFTTNGVAGFYLTVGGVRTGTNLAVEAANANWPLLSNQNGVSTGDLTASNQMLGAYLVGTSYGNVFGGTTGWQRTGNTSFLPNSYQPTCYTEYAVTPANGKNLTVYSLTLSALGGSTAGARMAVYYSLDGFATSAPLGTGYYAGKKYSATTTAPIFLLNTSSGTLTGDEITTIRTTVNVLVGQTLRIRVYSWIAGTGNRYFAAKNVTINAVSTTTPLPLSLLNFTAKARQLESILLNWTTQEEQSVKHFELEKSKEGKLFSTIAKVVATSKEGGSENLYQFIDHQATEGSIFYRLKIVDKDGTFSYSQIITVRGEKENKLTVTPNPASNIVMVQYPKGANTNQQLLLLTIEGKVIATYALKPNSTQQSIDITSLTKGSYELMLVGSKQNSVARFVKQ